MIVFSCGSDCIDGAKKHLTSLNNQTFQDFDHIIVEDASLGNNLFKTLHTQNKRTRTTIHKNTSRRFWLKNAIDYLIPVISGPEIVVVIDLDDWLFHENVLKNIHDAYEKEPDLLLTFGSYIKSNEVLTKKKHPNSIDVRNVMYKNSNIRHESWVFSHLKTFKGDLFKSIDPDHFKGPNGKWMICSYDRAIMYPMVEMAGWSHIKFIEDVQYVYNISPINNVHKIYKHEQVKYKRYIASLRPYEQKDFRSIL